jgi:hypothetical protein
VPDSAAVHLVEETHQAKDFIAHDEICQADLWPWPFVRVELHVSQRHRPRIEYGLRIPDFEVFDAAVVDGLAQPHQDLARRRKV